MDKSKDIDISKNIDKSMDIENKAFKKLHSFSLFIKRKKEQTIELFIQASNLYKIDRDGKGYMRCMEMASKLLEDVKDNYMASRCYLDMARYAKNNKLKNTVDYYKKYLELTTETKLGDVFYEIAEYYKSMGEFDCAIENFNQSIGEYELVNRKYGINKCLDCMARMYLNSNDYKMAGKTINDIGNNIGIGKKNCFFTSILAFLNYDVVLALKKLEDIKHEIDNNDYDFLKSVCDAVMNEDIDVLTNLISSFNMKIRVKNVYYPVIINLLKLIKNDTDMCNESNDFEDIT
jgi:tetratricopeptide (TPR) repeat protein